MLRLRIVRCLGVDCGDYASLVAARRMIVAAPASRRGFWQVPLQQPHRRRCGKQLRRVQTQERRGKWKALVSRQAALMTTGVAEGQAVLITHRALRLKDFRCVAAVLGEDDLNVAARKVFGGAVEPSSLGSGHTNARGSRRASSPDIPRSWSRDIQPEPMFTGREDTSADIQNEKRIQYWGSQLQAFQGLGDLTFGLGLGEGALGGRWMSDRSAVGRISAGAQRRLAGNTHNVYLSIAASFGLVGMLGYVGALLVTLAKAPRTLAMVFVVTAAALGMPVAVLEVFPANALVFFLWGLILGYSSRSSRSSSTIALPLGRA